MDYFRIPDLYIALAQCLSTFLIQAGFARKNNRRPAVLLTAAIFLAALFGWYCLSGLLSPGVGKDLLQRLVSYGILALYLWYVLDQDGKGIAFLTLRTILLSEFASSLEWQIEILILSARTPVSYTHAAHDPGDPLVPDGSFIPIPWRILLVAGVYVCFFFAAALIERNLEQAPAAEGAEVSGTHPHFSGRKDDVEPVRLHVGGRDLAEAVAVAILFLIGGNVPIIFSNEIYKIWDVVFPISVRALLFFSGVLLLLFLQQKIREIQMAAELQQTQFQLREQYEKYRNYQDSMELINLKYHDLKHQLAGLRAQLNEQEKEKWIDSMEQELDQYQPEYQTGNPVLDTLLSGRQVSMRRHGIQLTCVADGSLLSFMHVADICSVFGNALDNAIESVSLEEDPARRLIHLVVSRKNDFLFISCENYCSRELQMQDGLPKTSKQDTRNHGFGTRSIRQTVWKYHGTTTFRMEDHQFLLTILIPFPEQAA